jgi:hypothetical protein
MSRSKILIGSVPNESRSSDCLTPCEKEVPALCAGALFFIAFRASETCLYGYAYA